MFNPNPHDQEPKTAHTFCEEKCYKIIIMKNLKKICIPQKVYVVLLRSIQYFIEFSFILLFRQILKLSNSYEPLFGPWP